MLWVCKEDAEGEADTPYPIRLVVERDETHAGYIAVQTSGTVPLVPYEQ